MYFREISNLDWSLNFTGSDLYEELDLLGSSLDGWTGCTDEAFEDMPECWDFDAGSMSATDLSCRSMGCFFIPSADIFP